MKYTLLLYQDTDFEAKWDAMSAEEQAEILDQHAAFFAKATEAGATITGGNELGLSHTATTLRLDGDEFTVTDGPFAEVAEHLGGYYEIEARDLDHAIAIAKLLPNELTEIRPVVEHDG
jgi:hypothetical protein